MKLTEKQLNRMIMEAIQEVGGTAMDSKTDFAHPVPNFNGVGEYYAQRDGKSQRQNEPVDNTPMSNGMGGYYVGNNPDAKLNGQKQDEPKQTNDGLKGAASGGQNPAKVAMPAKLPETKKEAYKAIAAFGNGWLQKAKAAGWSNEMIQRCRDIFNGKYVPGQKQKEPMKPFERFPKTKEEYQHMLNDVKAHGYDSLSQAAKENNWEYWSEIPQVERHFTNPDFDAPLDNAGAKQTEPVDDEPMSNGMGGYYIGNNPDAQLPTKVARPESMSGLNVQGPKMPQRISLQESQLTKLVKEATLSALKQLMK